MSRNSPQNELNAKISEYHIYNGYNFNTGTKYWKLNPKSVYLFTVAGVSYGNIAGNLTAIYIIATGDTSSNTANISTLYKGIDATDISVNNGVLKYENSYQYCIFSLCKI